MGLDLRLNRELYTNLIKYPCLRPLEHRAASSRRGSTQTLHDPAQIRRAVTGWPPSSAHHRLARASIVPMQFTMTDSGSELLCRALDFYCRFLRLANGAVRLMSKLMTVPVERISN